MQRKIRRLLSNYGREIARRHLVMGAMGNISARQGGTVWIKSGGVWLERARPQDFVPVDAGSGRAKSAHQPSKEVFLHLGCYQARHDIAAVVHTHPVMATALATAAVTLHKSKRLQEIVGSPLAVLPYYAPGSKKLAEEVRRKIVKANAVLLANHGLVTVGGDIKEAYQRTLDCEQEAKKILQRLGLMLK